METEESIKRKIIELRTEIGDHRDEIDRHQRQIDSHVVAIKHLRDALRRQRVLATIEEVLLTNETEWPAGYEMWQWVAAIEVGAREAQSAAEVDDMAARRKIARIAACAASWMLAIDLAREGPGYVPEGES
jgi:hypothetical protein